MAQELPQGTPTPTATITAVCLAASFNDGATWQVLTLHRGDTGRWTTMVTAPATTTSPRSRQT
ncbi:MAG TPA: hypothetical protein VGS97_24230 [Actinocrinis sp.]|uniref:hypothetical protein n=1 Tax=Actinocrinis sp. TaxID=1920516 RepID=UPI002DDD3940|nr:hypothetical protein [Actinocrinis sp.]HEV2347226.1 hypothetical protein [Actinocrinis sp.]